MSKITELLQLLKIIENKLVFTVSLIFFNCIILGFIKDKILESTLIPIGILIINFIFLIIWLLYTNRLVIKRKDKIVLGIFIKCNNYTSHIEIKDIVKELRNDLVDKIEGVDIIIFGSNFKKNKSEIEKYLFRKSHIINLGSLLQLHHGKEKINGDKETKIAIRDIKALGFYHKKNSNDNDVNIAQIEQLLNSRKVDKNFDFIESNSFNDRIKIAENLEDLLVFQIGLYCVINKKLEAALNCLDYLYEIQKDHKTEANLLLRNLLKKVYTDKVIKDYLNDNKKEIAYKHLKRYFSLFDDKDLYSLTNTINFARLCFELDKYNDARYYTNKIGEISPNDISIDINNAFFAILDKKPKKLITHLTSIATHRSAGRQNYIEIISFLDKYSKSYTENELLFELTISFYNFLYLDKEMGKSGLDSISSRVEVSADIKFFILRLKSNTLSKGGTMLTSKKNIKKNKRA